MKIIGLDYGSKRIGVALSDELGLLASELCLIENTKNAVSRIKRLCKQNKVKKIVIGLPISLSGQEGREVYKVKDFAKNLAKKIKLPIDFEDERLTTSLALNFLKEKGVKLKKIREVQDKLAAKIILQDYLNKNKFFKQISNQ